MPTALDMARTVLGQAEGKDRAALMDYLKTGGANLDPATTAWCAAFVNASLQQAGYSGTGSNMARSFLDWGNAVEGQPQPGDVGIWPRGGDPTKGHVGFVESVDPETGTVQLLAGNQGDAVSVKQYALDEALGFRRPTGTMQQPPSDDPRLDTPSSGRPVGSLLPGQPVGGPVEAAGGGAGSDAPSAAANPYAALAASEEPEKKNWWELLGEGVSDAAGAMAKTPMPGYQIAAQPGPARVDVGGGAMIDPQAAEMKRQQLAFAMQRLNQGSLF